MKKNKAQRLAAKAAVTTPKTETAPVKNAKVSKPKKETPAPTSKGKKEENMDKLKGAAAVNTTKKITEKKDLKYKYPKEIDTLPTRKQWRAEVRRKIKAFEKEIAKLQNQVINAPEDQVLLDKKSKEADSYLKKVLVNP